MKSKVQSRYFLAAGERGQAKLAEKWQDRTKHTGKLTNEMSLNVTNESIEGYNFFTDSSCENCQDLVKTVNDCSQAARPVNAIPKISSNDFIQRKIKDQDKKPTSRCTTTSKFKLKANSTERKGIKTGRASKINLDLHKTGSICRTIIREMHGANHARGSIDCTEPDWFRVSPCNSADIRGRTKNIGLSARGSLLDDVVELTARKEKQSKINDYSQLCSILRENIKKKSQLLEMNNSPDDNLAVNFIPSDADRLNFRKKQKANQELLLDTIKTVRDSIASRQDGHSLSIEARKRSISNRSQSKASRRSSIAQRASIGSQSRKDSIVFQKYKIVPKENDLIYFQDEYYQSYTSNNSPQEHQRIKKGYETMRDTEETEKSSRRSLMISSLYSQSAGKLPEPHCATEYYPWLSKKSDRNTRQATTSRKSTKLAKTSPGRQMSPQAIISRLQTLLSSQPIKNK